MADYGNLAFYDRTFASIISQQPGNIMKTLALVTIVMSIPTMVFSAYPGWTLRIVKSPKRKCLPGLIVFICFMSVSLTLYLSINGSQEFLCLRLILKINQEKNQSLSYRYPTIHREDGEKTDAEIKAILRKSFPKSLKSKPRYNCSFLWPFQLTGAHSLHCWNGTKRASKENDDPKLMIMDSSSFHH